MRKLLLVALVTLPVIPMAARIGSTASSHDESPTRETAGEVELAPFMSRLQTYSQKLGFAIQAHNGPLSGFYLHEMEEALEEVEKKVPVHDGHQIAKLIGATTAQRVEALERLLKNSKATWSSREREYTSLIQSCNTCHQATAHGFIHILPAKGVPPFNQSFAPQNPSMPK